MLTWEGNVVDLGLPQRSAPIIGWGGRPKLERTDRYAFALAEMTAEFRKQWVGGPMVGPVLVHVRVFHTGVHRGGHAHGEPCGNPWPAVAVWDSLPDAGIVSDRDQSVTWIINVDRDVRRPRIEVEVKSWDEAAPSTGRR